MQQYREIRAQSRAGAVWTGKSRRHHRNFLGAYHRGPSSPPLSHPQQPQECPSSPRPSPLHPPARPTRAGGGETQTPETSNSVEVDSSAKSMNPRGGFCASIRAAPGGKRAAG